jgi:SAM-dependent methyltransferase
LTENQSEHDRWNNYYNIVEGRPPRDTLLFALNQFESEKIVSEKFAIDLGCGIGNDSMELMKREWSVLAIDKQPIALDRLVQRVVDDQGIDRNQIQTKVSSFEDLKIPPSLLLNSSYAIPFCHPDQFPILWSTITDSIISGGRFSGHLFGINDQWAGTETMTFLNKSDVVRMLEDFTIELMEEKDEMGQVASGEAKHWHLYSIVAKKNG